MVGLTPVPANSGLHQYIEAEDFVDCYATASELTVRQAAELVVQYPKWVSALMTLRRIVTTPFGLVNDMEHAPERIGFFPIETETDEEILAGFDDKHLNFRISIMAQAGAVYFGTWVRPHNLGGKIYLWLVMPFHVLICKNALKRVARHTQ